MMKFAWQIYYIFTKKLQKMLDIDEKDDMLVGDYKLKAVDLLNTNWNTKGAYDTRG